jgi:crotonobetainyl-CoA:carnitine CoA-transferase CaiB-like acyl-CoA transferase
MALLDSQVGVLANQALNFMASGIAPNRMGNAHPNLVPYQSFRTADGDIIVAVGNDRQFAKFCAILGLDGLAMDERFRTNAGRVTNRAVLIPMLADATAIWTRATLAARLEAEGVPGGPINPLDAVFADPQVVARGMAIASPGPDGPLPGLASPIVIDGERQNANRAAPRLDADGAAIRRELEGGR